MSEETKVNLAIAAIYLLPCLLLVVVAKVG
jgi:hypothetical protein